MCFIPCGMSLSGKHIWICPLNWGLGHASRSIPLIRALIKEGAEIYLASDGEAAELLKKEFPNLPCFELPSYQIRYGRRSAVAGLFWRLPGIFQAIRREQKAIGQLLKDHPCDLIIADNRYGVFASGVPSVLLSHQLNLPVAAAIRPFAKGILKHWLAAFDELWIPDWAGEASLAGSLSAAQLSMPQRHLGILSRLQPVSGKVQYDMLAILSGPEPQRSQLEKKLIEQMNAWSGPCCLVRGTKLPTEYPTKANVEVIDFATTEVLQNLIPQAGMVVCRTGYSSLMDLVQMEKSALVIPTPGQPEQEYLADYHEHKKWWIVQRQDAIDLNKAWKDHESLTAPKLRKMELAGWVKACSEMLSKKK